MKRPIIIIFITLLLFFSFLGLYLSHLEAEHISVEARDNVRSIIGDVKASLENRLYLNIHRTEGIKSLVAMNPNLTQEDFARAMKINFQGDHDLRNIGLAPNMVIRYMYPIEGNERAIGLDFKKTPEQFEMADLARKVNRTVLAGPFELVQGGTAIAARIPIFISESGTKNEYWGLASVVINIDDLFERIGLNDAVKKADIAIRGKDGLGEAGDVFFGSPNIFDQDPVLMTVELPHGSWQLAAVPAGGWAGRPFVFNYQMMVYSAVVFIIMMLNLFLMVLFDRMRRAEAKARKSNNAKSEFLANMSHEIRTPLNGVIGFTDLLRHTSLSPVQEQYVRNANVSGHVLLGIIDDILDFSKIEAGKMELEVIKTDMIELLGNSIDTVRFAAGQKGLELLLCIENSLPRYAMVDPVRLKQVFTNILSNAVKFTEKGEVELNASFDMLNTRRGRYKFSVRDTGIGVNAEQKGKLFKSFSQADSSTTRKYGGTGLGLVISDMIVRKMGSKISFESKEGEGSIFFFDLIADFEYIDKLDLSKIKDIRRCLIIDDNAKSLFNLKLMLNSLGIESDTCQNDYEALKLLEKAKPYGVIICDYHLPDNNGLQTIGIIRDKLGPSADKITFILMYCISDGPEIHDNSNEMGVFNRMAKPVKLDELYECLCKVNGPEFYQRQSEEKENLAGTYFYSKVLIAEDTPLNMTMIKALLSVLAPAVELIEADNGIEAIKQYKKEKPDMILMDVHMPEMDGLAAAASIRKHEKGTRKRIAIIAITAGATREEQEKCIAAGMDDFISKPIEMQKLKLILDKYNKKSVP